METSDLIVRRVFTAAMLKFITASPDGAGGWNLTSLREMPGGRTELIFSTEQGIKSTSDWPDNLDWSTKTVTVTLHAERVAKLPDGTTGATATP